MKKSGLIAVSLIFALSLLALFGGCGEDSGDQSDLEAQIAELRAELDSVILLNQYLTISSGTVNGLAGPHVIFEGVNVHIRNGDDATNTINGVGNLLVGYNEEPTGTNRGGSHNLIVGPNHNYPSYGGFAAGRYNTVSGIYASVSGGEGNTASGGASSVSGGYINDASFDWSSVSGGRENTASGAVSSVSGGGSNMASGDWSSVSGGGSNEASGIISCINGGEGNTASGGASSVSGGEDNTASGGWSSVSGGYNNVASGADSSVSGGAGRSAATDADWAAGSQWEDN